MRPCACAKHAVISARGHVRRGQGRGHVGQGCEVRQGRCHVRQERGHVELDAAVRGVRGFTSSRDGVGSPVGVLLASNFERTPSAALRDFRVPVQI